MPTNSGPGRVLAMLGLLAVATPAQTSLTTEVVVSGLTEPIFVTHAPGDRERLFVLERATGRIRVVRDGAVQASPFLDLGHSIAVGGEQGLLGLAFHPDYRNNGWLFVNFTNTNGDTKVRRYTAATADRADGSSGVDVLTIAQPQDTHNGGMLAFGPNDGYLYISTGDGGLGNDAGPGHASGGNAQSLGTRLGKILRIDVDALPFTVPADNPFVSAGFPAEEIWALGLRNPWRFSFDRKTGDMYIGDIGQNTREEISFDPAGGSGGVNFGWRCMEGTSCTGLSGCECDDEGLSPPIHDYGWGAGTDGGRSAIGGYVYRGEAIPDLKGTYFFADHSVTSGQLWSFRVADGLKTEFENRTVALRPPAGFEINSPCAFGEDLDGELYIVDRGAGGEIFKIVPDSPFLGLGHATEGTHGEPRLHGEGRLGPGTAGALKLTNGLEQSPLGLLFVGAMDGAAPFFGGVLNPVPWIGNPIFITTDEAGSWTISWTAWPPGLPSGFEIYFQYALEDPGVAAGGALSNSLKATIP